MKHQIESRLEGLKKEYKKGEERLAALEQELANVRDSMLRISGAVQVLEELHKNCETEQDNAPLNGKNEKTASAIT